MTKLSQRVRSLSETGTVAFSARAAALAAAGGNIINLAVGAPDYGTPDAVAEAAIAAIRRGETRYRARVAIEVFPGHDIGVSIAGKICHGHAESPTDATVICVKVLPFIQRQWPAAADLRGAKVFP